MNRITKSTKIHVQEMNKENTTAMDSSASRNDCSKVLTKKQNLEEQPSDYQPGPHWSYEVKEFCHSVSVSGLAYVVDDTASVFRRLWWSLLLAFGIVVMVYQISIQIILYYKYPVRVTLRENFRTPLRFPAVTICSESRFSRDKIQDYGRGLEGVMDAFYPPFVHPRNFSGPPPNYSLSGVSNDWRQTYENISISVNDSLLGCFFRGFGYEECKPSYFSSVDNNTEQCITFNKDGALGQQVAGGSAGLMVLLYNNQSDNVALYDYSAGYRVVLHEPGVAPDVWRGFKVSPGHVTTAKVLKEEVNRLPPPHEDCAERQLDYFSKYTEGNCFLECLSKKIQLRCGCILIGHPGPMSVDACDPAIETSCAKGVALTFDNNTAHECNCPIECQVTSYIETISFGTFANTFVSYMVDVYYANEDWTFEDFWDETAVLVIYYPKLSYKSVTSKMAYTSTSLFCDMGGALGLLLGSTFLTLYEFVDFFFWFVWKHRKRNV